MVLIDELRTVDAKEHYVCFGRSFLQRDISRAQGKAPPAGRCFPDNAGNPPTMASQDDSFSTLYIIETTKEVSLSLRYLDFMHD